MKKTTDFLALVTPDSTARNDALAEGALSDLARAALSRLCAQTRPGTPSIDAQSVLGDPCAAAMAFALCDADDEAAAILVAELMAAGLSVEELCHEHLAPAARRLGMLWDEDRLPFTEVAMATARIQSILRRMPQGRLMPGRAKGPGAIFAAVPGELHTLGVMMAADLFRRSGWDVSLLVGLTHDELLTRFTRDDRPVIGLSCSGDHSYPALRRLLAAIGNARPDVQVLLSGQIIEDRARIADLPVPVLAVGDLASAQSEMARIEAVLTSPKVARLRPARGRAGSFG